MGRLGRDVYRRRLARILSRGVDEEVISLVSAVIAVHAGQEGALRAVRDLPREALGAELGSRFYIPPWSLETLVNELLATPKAVGVEAGTAGTLNAGLFSNLRAMHAALVKLENAEDGIFLSRRDVFHEMARIAQRQFPWQRGFLNAPHLYRSLVLYGTGSAKRYFEARSGIAISDFMRVGVYLSGALGRSDYVSRDRDLSAIGVTPAMHEAALARLAIAHRDARRLASAVTGERHHSGYRRSILRDFPILAFGDRGQRLRAPIPELVMLRCTSGLYLDVVRGGADVWTGIGRRFEAYLLEYLQAMMEPYRVSGEGIYGPRKARLRAPDILVSDERSVVMAVECKAKRMSFEARYANDPVAEAALGFAELAKGIYQLWRFLAHARLGLYGEQVVAADCQAVIVTADSWLALARHQLASVLASAHALADQDGTIEAIDRRGVAFCQIDDVEFVLQNGTADALISACRVVASAADEPPVLSVAQVAGLGARRAYPFTNRIGEMLPWMRADHEYGRGPD